MTKRAARAVRAASGSPIPQNHALPRHVAANCVAVNRAVVCGIVALSPLFAPGLVYGWAVAGCRAAHARCRGGIVVSGRAARAAVETPNADPDEECMSSSQWKVPVPALPAPRRAASAPCR